MDSHHALRRHPGRPMVGFEPLEKRACFSAGGLDGSFGLAGRHLMAIDAASVEVATAVTVDPQGRTLVAGSTVSGGKTFFLVGRLLPGGGADQSFGVQGFRLVDFGSAGATVFSAASGIAIDDQGRIVVAGSVETAAAGRDFGICRLLADGSLDHAFDGDGKALVGFDRGGTLNDNCSSLAIDSHGRIVIAGTITRDGNLTDFGVARLTDTGQLDAAFDGDGKAVIPFQQGGVECVGRANGVAVDSLGRIVVCGSVLTSDRVGGGVARLLPNGQADTSFGTAGKIFSSVGKSSAKQFNDVRIDAAGRILLAGIVQKPNTPMQLFAQRLKATGSPSLSFGSGGTAVIPFSCGPKAPGVVLTAPRAAIDASGRIILAVTVRPLAAAFTAADYGVARLTSKGKPDPAFGTAGCATVGFNVGGDDSDFLGGVAVDPQGRILVAGMVQRSSGGDYDIGVARVFA